MFEFNIQNKLTGELDIIFGHTSTDAFNRNNLNPNDWIILTEYYID